MPDAVYPRNQEQRCQFWERQLALGLKRVEPFMLVGDELKKIHDNVARTTREKAQEGTARGADNDARVRGNKVFAWTDQTISNMLDRNPVFRVTGRNKYSMPYASVPQTAINLWYEETRQYEHERRMLLDAFLYPYAVKKLGWFARIDEKTSLDLTDLATFSEDDPAAAANFLAGGIPLQVLAHQDHEAHIEAAVRVSQDVSVDPAIVEAVIDPYVEAHRMMLERPAPGRDTTVQFDQPYGVRWRPRDFIVDTYASNGVLDAGWVAFRWRKRHIDVITDPLYRNTAGIEARDDMRPADAPEKMLEEMGFDDYATIEGWEIWAKDWHVARLRRANLRITLIPGYNKLLQHEEEWPFTSLDDFPAEVLSFQTATDTWYNKPALALAGADSIATLRNEFLDSMLYEMRKSKNLHLADKELFGDEEDAEAIMKLPDCSVRLVEGLRDKPGPPVFAWPFQQIQQDKVAFNAILGNEFDEAAGTPQPIRSASPDTATEASIIERRVAAREQNRANLFAIMQVRTATKFWQMASQFQPNRNFLIDPLTNKVAKVDETVAKGEYQFKIDVSSRAVARAVEFDRWSKALNITAGVTPIMMQLGFTPPNLAEMLRELFRRGLDIPDVERFLPGGSDQDQLVMQALADPLQRQGIIESIVRMRGGGDMVSGAGPGPINPQQFAARPKTEGDMMTAANR